VQINENYSNENRGYICEGISHYQLCLAESHRQESGKVPNLKHLCNMNTIGLVKYLYKHGLKGKLQVILCLEVVVGQVGNC
jgi:hypothetical protein